MRFLAALLFIIAAFWGASAAGQALPYFADPSARDSAPDLGPVASIRFLTTADFPPFNYKDKSGTLTGFNVDLAKAICSELKLGCTIQAWPWDQAGKALADNQGDALIAGLALTPQNGAEFDFSSIYLGLPGRFVTRIDSSQHFDPAKLAGKTIAVRKGTAHEAFVRRYLPKARLAEFDTEIDALAAVAGKQADAYFGDALRASFWLNDNPGCCGFAGEPYFRPDLFGPGLAIAVPAGHDAVRDVINSALVRLKRDGTLDDLYLRWFPVGFY
jgi:polar amino acid transport system substrate-binding protein